MAFVVVLDIVVVMVNCADMAMYYSKEHGRNKVTHYTEILNSIEKLSENIAEGKENS